jgi:hypothetical protein
VRLRQPVQKVDLTHVDDEPFELTEEIEAQIIGNILPDDDDLLSDVLDVGYTAHANMGDDVDDDIFYTGGGMELETDENKKNTELNGANDGLGLLNGTMNGEHPYGEHPSRTLFVRNINSSVEDSELKLLFEVCSVFPFRSNLLFLYRTFVSENNLLFTHRIMEKSATFTLPANIVVL